MKRFLRQLRAFEDHWLADVIGAFCLFGLTWELMLIGYGMGLK